MSPSALNPTTEVIKVVCSMSLEEMPEDVKALEERIVEKVQQSGREFYAAVFYAFQQRWLQERSADYTAVRWRTIDQVTPFGLIRLPVRVVRERGLRKGGYLTLSKALLSPKATRLLSPWVEKRALEAATSSNSAGGSRVMALGKSQSERVADLEVRAISWSAFVRAARSAMVA